MRRIAVFTQYSLYLGCLGLAVFLIAYAAKNFLGVMEQVAFWGGP